MVDVELADEIEKALEEMGPMAPAEVLETILEAGSAVGRKIFPLLNVKVTLGVMVDAGVVEEVKSEEGPEKYYKLVERGVIAWQRRPMKEKTG